MKIELDVHTGDETYLGHIRRKLPQALDEFLPDIVVYNAGKWCTHTHKVYNKRFTLKTHRRTWSIIGTDVLLGDPLGILDITDNASQSHSMFLLYLFLMLGSSSKRWIGVSDSQKQEHTNIYAYFWWIPGLERERERV